MIRDYYKEFIFKWLPTYKKQYKEAITSEERRVIKDNLYNNIHLKEKEKDILWERIVKE